jgi:hypothetical protein
VETARNFWSNVGAVAYKEASVLRHDKALIGMVLAQPIMMLLLFGFALSNKPANVPWAVLDRSQTALSRRFVEAIRTSGYFLPPHAVGSYGEGRELLKTGRALAFLVVPAGFRRDTERDGAHVQLLLDGSDPLSSARIEAYVGQIAAAFATRPDAPRIVSPASLPGALAVPTLLVKPDAERPHVHPHCHGGHVADQLVPVGDGPRTGRGARDRHL